MTEFVRRVTRLAERISPRLESLDIELTERCDNNCIHCCINLPAGDLKARRREMTTEQVKRILREAVDLGCLCIRLSGGEPLLRTDFEELYLHARRLGLKVVIFTNARRITERLADLFRSTPPLLPLEVTVYGMRQDSYEAVSRAPGSFAEFRHGIDLLLERRVPFVVKGALLPPNRGEMDEFETWARTIPWMNGPAIYSMFFDLRSRRDDDGKNRLIGALRVSPREGLEVLARDEKRYRTIMGQFGSRFMSPQGDELFGCGAGGAINIDAYGQAQPCMGVRAPQLSMDVLESSLEGALDRFAHLKDVRAINPEYLRRCARCFLKGMCEQCPAKSWAEHGTLDTPVEYLCQVAHAQARYLGWLDDTEWGWEVEEWRARIDS